MTDSNRSARKLAIADHIWEAFEEMAHQMGSDRDALVNQALFTFARLNGFLHVAPPTASSKVPTSPAKPPAMALGSVSAPKFLPREEDSARREVAERVLETANELERLIKDKSASDDDFGDDLDAGPAAPRDFQDEPLGARASTEGNTLYLIGEGGEMEKISKDRFVIGRGKHCDYVINSGKVSREHAVIIREGLDYFIEDLGSSNGTWFNKQRIKRRKVEDGDEYFVCAEKIKLVMR